VRGLNLVKLWPIVSDWFVAPINRTMKTTSVQRIAIDCQRLSAIVSNRVASDCQCSPSLASNKKNAGNAQTVSGRHSPRCARVCGCGYYVGTGGNQSGRRFVSSHNSAKRLYSARSFPSSVSPEITRFSIALNVSRSILDIVYPFAADSLDRPVGIDSVNRKVCIAGPAIVTR